MCRILVKEKNDAEIELNYFDLCVFFFIFTSTHQINYDIFYERLQTFAASSTTKTGRHDIAEILLKLALKHQISINQSNLTVCLLDMI
jgi:hypothetical protein